MKKTAAKLSAGAGWSLTRQCAGCGRPEDACRCPQTAAVTLPPGKQTARLRLEKRCGKAVTVVAGLVLAEADGKELLRQLRALCGAGGTFKGGELEVQGEQRAAVKAFLLGKGFRIQGA